MAFPRTIVKISNSSLLNIKTHVKNTPRMPMLFKQNTRTYWSGKSKIFVSRFNKDYEYKYLPENCGKQPLSRVEPYKKFSKCSQNYKPITKSRKHLFKFKKVPPVIKEKPTDCHKMELKKTVSSFWKNIFGIKSKKSSLSCIPVQTCKNQMMLRQKDPLDSCHQSIPRNVPIYNKIIDTKKLEYNEPQPKSTPSYKVSRAALCKMIIADVEKTLCQCVILWPQNHDNWTSNMFKKNSIPFQEMRPPGKKKKAFNCKDGISTEDIIYPSNTANNFCISNINFHSIIK